MPRLRISDHSQGLRVAPAVLAIAATSVLAVGPAAALECVGVALDDGCIFTATGGDRLRLPFCGAADSAST